MTERKRKESGKSGIKSNLFGSQSVFVHMAKLESSSKAGLDDIVANIAADSVECSVDEATTQKALCDILLSALDDGNQDNALSTTYTLGLLRGSLIEKRNRPIEDKIKRDAGIAQRTLPFKAHQYGDRFLKKTVQATALDLWNQDYCSNRRVSEMTAMIMDHLSSLNQVMSSLLTAYLPEANDSFISSLKSRKLPSQKTVHGWVSEIAPSHAKRPGRPKAK